MTYTTSDESIYSTMKSIWEKSYTGVKPVFLRSTVNSPTISEVRTNSMLVLDRSPTLSMVCVAAVVVSNSEVTDTCDINVNTMIASVIIISPEI